MPTFAFEARDEAGTLTAGSIVAENMEDAGELLSQRHLFVVRMGAHEQDASATHSTPSEVARVGRSDVAWQFSQLAIMMRTGIRLSDALECLSRHTSKPALRRLNEEVCRLVSEGRPFSDALSMFPRSYPPSLVALIRASELSGTMSVVLDRAAAYLRSELRTLRRVRAALLYPAFMMLACVGVTVFLLMVILPRFAAVFAARGATLPLPTRMLMAASEALVHSWHLWLGGAAALVLAITWWLRTEQGMRTRDHVMVFAPLVSRLFNPLYQGRAFRTLAVLLQAGVPLMDTMRVVRGVVSNTYYQDLWSSVESNLQRGGSVAAPMFESPVIPEPVALMVECGDRSARLGFVFDQLAEAVEDEYEQVIKAATQFIEPAMIMVMGSIVGFVAASVMLPLFRSSMLFAS